MFLSARVAGESLGEVGHGIGARDAMNLHPGIVGVATTHLTSPTLRAGPLPLPPLRG